MPLLRWASGRQSKGQRPSRSEPVGRGGSYHPPFVPDGAALVVVRQRLEAARRDGFDFETAWRSVLANSDGYGHALLWAEPEWRAAYERADAPRRVSAVSILCDDT
jgi:hypothetical protein